MPDDMAQGKPGDARCPGLGWEDLVKADTRPVPDFLARESYEYLGSEPLPVSRYTSPEFFRLELERMWPRVWQFAAREEDMPDPGNFVVYENAGRSYLIVRQGDGSVRAMHNVCLHRGRKLKTESGSAAAFRCAFHGFTWGLDGSIRSIPCRWDFAHLTDEKMRLPEASVGRWGGYIFVRESAEGPSLEEYLAPLPSFLDRWHHEDCYTAVWVAKVIRANWKATAEAFIESFHAPETHPQLTPFIGDWNAAYGMWGDNVNLDLTPFGTPSPIINARDKSEQWILDGYAKAGGRTSSPNLIPGLRPGQTARQALAEAARERYRETTGHDVGDASDAEMIDALTYNVFPNFSPWGGFMPTIVYRWRPWPDHRSTLMEVRILLRTPKGTARPRGVPMHLLGEDEPFSAAAELGDLGPVFDQDMANLPYVQQGMEMSKNGEIQLADYQEIRIRHFHRTLDKYLGG